MKNLSVVMPQDDFDQYVLLGVIECRAMAYTIQKLLKTVLESVSSEAGDLISQEYQQLFSENVHKIAGQLHALYGDDFDSWLKSELNL